MFKVDPAIQQAYSVEIQNQFDILNMENVEDSNIQLKYDKLIEAVDKACKEAVPKLSRVARKPWVTQGTREIIKERDAAKRIFYDNRTDRNHATWRQLAEKTDQALVKDKTDFYDNICCEATVAANSGNSKPIFDLVRKASGKS